MALVQNRYNPPQGMSKRTAERWAKVAPNKAKPNEQDLVNTPIDLYGKIYVL
jgi:hypothetical protein